MGSDAAPVRTPEAVQDPTRRAIGATFNVVRAAAAEPSVADDLPNGATPVLIPVDDPDLAKAEIDQGLAAILRGENVYVRHVGRATTTEE